MHALSLGIPLVGAILALVLDLYNPVPQGLRRCYISIYPPNCSAWDGVECKRGSVPLLMALMVVPGLVSMTFFMCCSILLYLTIRQRLLRSARTSQYNLLNNTQSMATQALLYSMVFFNSWIWVTVSFLISFIGGNIGNDLENSHAPFAILVLGDLFWLGQGFFNFIVFIRPRFVRIFHRVRESDQNSVPPRSVILSFISALRETVNYETGGNSSQISSSEGSNDKNWIQLLFSRNRSKQASDSKSSQDRPNQEQENTTL